MMAERKRNLSVIVALVVVVLVIVIQVLSWRRDGTLNAGAFLLLVLVIGPLYAFLRGRNPERL